MKRLTNKEILADLLDKIQEIKRINIGEISILSGYKRENYLSERLSTGEISNKVIKAVKALYERAKLNPEVLNKDYQKEVVVKDAATIIIDNQAELMAYQRVILSILAEVQAAQLKRLPVELASIYRQLVKDEAKQVRAELLQRS